MAAKAWARGQERSVALMGKADVAKGIAETRQAQDHGLAGAVWPAQEAGPHKQAPWALAYSPAAGHLEDK